MDAGREYPKSFRELLIQQKIPFVEDTGHHHTRQGWINLDCPFCSPHIGKFRLGYAKSTGSLHCWKCGSHRELDTIVLLTGLSPFKARQIISNFRKLPRSRKLQSELKPFLQKPRNVEPMQKPHRDYLRQRNLDPEQIEKIWSVQGIGFNSDPGFNWSLYIPVIYQDQELSWTTRTIKPNKKQRYRSASSSQERYPHKNLLYGEDLATDRIIVVEGPVDAWTIGPGAVALFGTSYTKEQLLRISKYQSRAICFDQEPDAQKMALRLFHDVQVYPGETFLVELETGNDPSSIESDELCELRRKFLEPPILA